MIQQDLFGGSTNNQENPLTNRRVGFIGSFKNRAALIRKVKELGASPKSKEGLTRDTQILVMGSDISQDILNRQICYEHDGWKPLKIHEENLNNIFKGQYAGYETPAVLKKQISIDMSYYYWTPPVYIDNDEEEGNTGVRCSSPLEYGEMNSIYGKEIYVPKSNSDLNILRQIIGNYGGYANAEYNDETNIILLSAETFHLLEQGIKDEVIEQIEKQYNESPSPVFNIQFTNEIDFIAWVNKRIEMFPDESTIQLLNIYQQQQKYPTNI